MKPRCFNQSTCGLTVTEMLVIIVVLAVLVAVLLPAFISDRPIRAPRVTCVNNLKQVGLAFRIWAEDNNGKFPMEISTTNGGTMELTATGDTLTTFQIMSNELTTPKLLFCPEDTGRVLTTSFGAGLTTKNISYFIGLDADTNRSSAFLSGDDNFAFDGVEIRPGLLETSVETSISWTGARHKFVGNIGFADGSVETLTATGLRQALRQTGAATTRLAIP